MLTKVILSLAANRYQKSNLARARRCLGEVLTDISYTAEQWTNPMGGTRKELYLNQLAAGYTTLTREELMQRCKTIEHDFGRTPQKRRLGIVPIDIDILLYGEQRMHESDWDRPYIASLMQELQ